MNYYFQLQFKILCRKLTALGIPPVIGFIIGGIAFYYLSNTLFDVRKHANYIYMALAIAILFKVNNHHRSNFVKAHFSKINYIKIQFSEKFLAVLPFILFLAYKKEFLVISILVVTAILASFFNFRNNNSIYIPTPFSKKPFEFSVGFRKTFFVFPLFYALAIISGQVGNVNLGVFALIVIFITTTIYYTKREPDMYIWMHKHSPKEFIHYKVRQGIIYLLVLQLPAALILAIAFPEHFFMLLFILILSALALCVRILMKYAITSHKGMNLVEGFIYFISVVIFPFLLILLPHYYKQATHKLSNILS